MEGAILEREIIKLFSPQDLIEQYRQTPYFKFRFGAVNWENKKN